MNKPATPIEVQRPQVIDCVYYDTEDADELFAKLETELRAANQRADEAFNAGIEAAAIRVAVMGGYYGLDEAQTYALAEEIKALKKLTPSPATGGTE